MAIIKCKMCGGDLNLIEGVSTAECEYCGSVQTIPNLDDEKKLIQFERAERLRKQCEFDKATGIYENIVADFRQEAEAYWGLVLCKYGIEYVDDPATGKKIPTCHRSSFESIMEDGDFELVLENADNVARRVYREEAKVIEELRKNIISVSSNEEPYDIFICYKETAENGDRTLDSVLAQDVYDALTERGYRVFFSRITLEDKLGMEYEPYIFAALNSAKIMLAFGTDYDYYNAVWVKNEWSRFLKLMAKDKEKHLIPCYKGIDAYDIPKEFAKLQAQDLGKVGATQDLLRGIEKLLPKETVRETVAVQSSANNNPTVESYLKRAFMFLEDGNWNSADEYCERVLDIDPENAYAYLGKLLAELQLRTQDDLSECAKAFDTRNNYQKALRFADADLRKDLETLKEKWIVWHKCEEEKHIARQKREKADCIARQKREEEERIRKKRAMEEQRRCATYNNAIKLLKQSKKEEAYSYLKILPGYKDADSLRENIKKDFHSTIGRVERNSIHGFINGAGKIVMEPQFAFGSDFGTNGLASIKLHGEWGYINETGEMVIQPRFDTAWRFAANGLACVKMNGKYGYINEAGKMVIPSQFDDAKEFEFNGLARVELNGKWGFINEAGEMVIEPQFACCYDVNEFGVNGLARVKLNDKYGYINEAGKKVIPPQFDYAGDFEFNSLALVQMNDKWGYINEAGKIVIQPQFDTAWCFAANGLARVKLNGKYGHINEAGEMVIRPQFDSAGDFGFNGLACVRLNRECGYINEAGEMVIESQFDDADSFATNGLARVKLYNKYGYINEAGEMVIRPQFNDADSFGFNGLARVELNGKWGFINQSGKMVVAPQFSKHVFRSNFTMIFHSQVNRAKQIQEQQWASWRVAGVCQHCGGQLKGLFSKKCVSCGKPKDY